MTQKELFDKISTELSTIYSPEEARAITFSLFEELASCQKHQIFLNPNDVLENAEQLLKAAEELKTFRPLQYVVGQGWFCGMSFEVDENVLIPRPETEELVNLIVKDNVAGDNLKILDIGTGSGCIAVSLAKLMPRSVVSAFDISPSAIEIATKNAKKNGVAVEFSLVDILTENPNREIDIIVSNPPYVANFEKPLMRRNVLDYEPHLALFVEDDDTLLFYRKIALYAKKTLVPGGRLYFEINENYGAEMAEMLRENGFSDVKITKDIFDKDRFAQAVWR